MNRKTDLPRYTNNEDLKLKINVSLFSKESPVKLNHIQKKQIEIYPEKKCKTICTLYAQLA